MTTKSGTSDIVTRAQGLHVRAIREAMREADFIASTDAVDSYDEVIDQASWRLDRFKTNPIILYGHQSFELPVGQATRCAVVNGQLEVTIRFATADANQRAEEVWNLVQQHVLRAVSVGFKPTDGKYELREGKDVFVLYGCDLREVSVVAVPANHECLAKMKAASLMALGVGACTAGAEMAFVHDSRTPEMQERIRSAITARDAADADGTGRLVNIGGGSVGPRAVERGATMTIDANGIHIKTTPELPAPSHTTIEGAKSAAEQDMDLKEATERLEKSDKALVEAKVSDKANADKATAAEARAKAVEAERDTLTAEKAALTKEHTKAAEDRDAAVARAEKAEAGLIALEVDALIGKKITAAEKDDFIALRKNSPDLFTSMVAKRAPMSLEDEITKDGKKNGAAPGAGDASDLLAEFQKSAGI